MNNKFVTTLKLFDYIMELLMAGDKMENYKVLIVDDEAEVRCGIIECVDWAEYGFEVIGEAENGEDALEIAAEFPPDLIITDIKMPYMTGLEMIKKLETSLPSTKIIIITGFDDFDYAKQAVTLNVIEYVVKPVSLSELKEILINAKAKMDEEHALLRNIEFLEDYYKKSIPILKESFLLGLLEGRFSNQKAFSESKLYGIETENKLFAVSCIRLDTRGVEDARLMMLSVRETAEQVFEKHIKAYSVLYTGLIVFLSVFEREYQINLIISTLNEVCRISKKHFTGDLSAGIGHIVNTPEEIFLSYRGAQAALDYRVITGSGKAIFIEDIEPNSNAELSLDARSSLLLLGAIRAGNAEKIRSIINNILGRCEDMRLPYEKYQTYLFEILNTIMSLSSSFGIGNEQIFGDNIHPFGKLSSFESKTEIAEWFIKISSALSESIHREMRNNSGKIVDEAKEYAKKHFRDYRLSIEKMCGVLHVSPAYFSTLFKKETGGTFVNYIADLRMREAKRLLLETDFKTYVVAEMVGFEDANYFSFVFKKHFGMSPTKFRSGQFEE